MSFSPAEFSIKNRLIMIIVIMASLIGGWYAYQNMARFEDPEFTIRTAVVVAQYPGATPEEVANEVSDPLETAIQQLQEVDEITSQSSAGLARINVDIKFEFSPSKASLQAVWAKLRNKVRDASAALPPGALEPIVNDDFGDVYGLYYLLTGENFTPNELEDYGKQLRTDLLSVDGVAKVALHGLQREAIFVEISRERAAALGVSINQLYNDLEQQNSVVSAGNVQVGNRRLVIQPSGSVDSVSALENIIVSTASVDTVIYLRDIATVTRGYQTPPELLMRYQGQPAIGIGVSNVTGANVVKMGLAIDAKLAAGVEQRPLGMELHEYYHQGKVVDASVKDFAINVIAALIIVLVTLIVFMGARSAMIIGAVLLLTISATLATMYLIDIPMHRISLGALIIALGMLVDNAIVVTEGILVGTQQGQKTLDISKKIVRRTMWPLLGGTLAGIIAFAPIGFAPGSTAEYTGHLFWVVMISLCFSWVFAITIVPFLADLLFKELAASTTPTAEGRFLGAYKSFLRIMLRLRWLPIGVTVGLFLISIWGFQFVKPGFFPASTTPQLVVDYWLPEGTDISQVESDMLELESYLLELEGLEGIQTLIGAGGLRYMLVYGPESANSSYGQFLIKTDGYEVVADLIPKIQMYIDSNYPDAQARVWRFQLGPGGGSKIEALFTGPDPVVLRQLANAAKAIMAANNDAISIKDDWRQLVSVIQPNYSEARGRRLGVSREDLSNALATNFLGRKIGVYREGDKLIPIIHRAPQIERADASDLGGIQILSSATGRSVPLSETINGIDIVWRDSILRRLDRVWAIKAQCDPRSGVLPSALQSAIRDEIEAIELPPGYTMQWKGEAGDSADANSDLASTIPLGLLAMVLVTIALFNALRQPAVIWLIVPLALIGVVLGLVVTGTPMEFMAILGLLSLSGLLIKNAVVLVDQMDLEIREGKPRFDAVVDSAASRVRPVAMGALTTVLGVIPLFYDAFFKSMAVVLVFGLTFATLLTLVIAPALYSVFFRISPDERGN